MFTENGMISQVISASGASSIGGARLACRDCENDVDAFLLCVGKFDAIQRKKDQHDMGTDPLVAIHKGIPNPSCAALARTEG